MSILSRFQLVKSFVFDMDGVLTDGTMQIFSDELPGKNQWVRSMNVRDGYAIQLAVKMGFPVIIISGSDSQPVAERLKKLGVEHVYMAVKDKANLLRELAEKNNLLLSEMLYMGDDIPDYHCMKMVGLAACPADAISEIKEISSYISPVAGGRGCVRDVIENVLKLTNKWGLDASVKST